MSWSDDDFDDETMVYSMVRDAIARREYSARGVVWMLKQPPGSGSASAGEVIDLELLDALGEGRVGSPSIVEETVAALRRLAPDASERLRRRILYALIRLVCPDAPEVDDGLADPVSYSTVIAALMDPTKEDPEGQLRGRARFPTLPRRLFPALSSLMETKLADPRLVVAVLRTGAPER
ncbi:MAG: hypothetical protein AAGF12_05550 [Myxococcota bacterium]